MTILTNGHLVTMSQTGARPEPQIDPDPDEGNAAGGVDAIEEPVQVPPLTPDVPSAQLSDDDVPDAIQEGEEPDSDANVEDPSAEPAD